MTTTRFEQVFGRARLRMATDPCVEVIREASAPGERRRYTKRFLATAAGDLRAWGAREARILAHLRREGVRCVPERAAFDARVGTLQTFDAGVTVEHWVTLVTVERDGRVVPHVFADCAHWWALAHHTLRALETLHLLHLVHLDVKPDNLCVPALAGEFAADPAGSSVGLKFARLALIDLAFSLSPTEPLASTLPIGAQSAYRYQSPRLLEALQAGRSGDLRPARALDWRCDLYSLAAMLRRYLPAAGSPAVTDPDGWTATRHARAIDLLAALDDAHDREVVAASPHQALIEMCETGLQEPDLVGSLLDGFTLAQADAVRAPPPPSTPLTCIVSSPASGAAPVRSSTGAAPTVDRAPAGAPAPPALAPQALASTPSATARERHVAPATDDPTTPVVVVARSSQTASPRLSSNALNHDEPPTRAPTRPPARPTGKPLQLRAAAALLVIALVSTALIALDWQDGRRDAPVPSAGEATDASAPMPAAARPADVSTFAAHAPDRGEQRGAPVATGPAMAALGVDAATVRRAADKDSGEKPPPPIGERPPPRLPDTSPPPAHAAPDSRPTAAASPAHAAPDSRPAAAAPPARPDESAVAAIPSGAVEDIAARTERDVARVLALAASARGRDEEQRIVQVARAIQPVAAAAQVSAQSPATARRLNAEARTAWERGDIDRALALQQRAFRANPNDAEVTGNLAFYYLKTRPAQPALARRLALYALAARGQKFPAGRVEDWGTLAVASSLEGREADAAKALVVMSTVSGNPERACRAARLAVAQYGRAMKAPADAMLARIRERGAASGAPSCG